MKPEPWFCPSCQKHHGPHVDTCPGGTGGIGVQPPISDPSPISDPWGLRSVPRLVPFVPSLPPAYPPTPWVPYEPTWRTTTVRPGTNIVAFGGTYAVATGLQ